MSSIHGLALLSALVLVAAPVTLAVTKGGGSEPTGSGSEPPPPAAVTELGGVLSRAGLSGDALTAAGVASVGIAEIVADAEAFIQGAGQNLTALDQAFVAAKTAEEALRREVKTGRASQETVSQLAACKVATGQAESSRSTYLEGVFLAGTSSLTLEQVSTLRNVRENRTWHLDLAYLVVDRSENEWVALTDALATRKIALAAQAPVPPQSQALLAQADANQAVAAAKTNLATYRASVQTAWNTAVSQ